jgi:DNA-binding beta-propeller fold protein YncE
LLAKWGSQGTGNGESDALHGIDIDSSGNVYVADTFNHRIQKFDSNGNFMTKWGSYGNGKGQFNVTYGVAIDSIGYVYVADPGLPKVGGNIQKFSPLGQ